MTTLTLKPKLEKPKLKWPRYWRPFIGKKVIVETIGGNTWVGRLKEVHNYELVLDQDEGGEMLLVKGGIESIRHAS